MNWKYFGKVHGWLFRVSGGRLGANMGRIKVVMLESTGRKSGLQRTTPLACYPYKDSVVISASNSGLDHPPAWYLNLKANPACNAQLGTDKFAAVAVELTVEECDEALPAIFENNPHQREYREQTDRHSPLVWLKRA